MSRQLVDAGDTALSSAEHAKDDQQRGRPRRRKRSTSIATRSIKDPYNVDATLKLAVAYDKVLSQGLRDRDAQAARRSSRATRRTAGEANRKIDDIDANGAWFKGYRKDAMAAVGR